MDINNILLDQTQESKNDEKLINLPDNVTQNPMLVDIFDENILQNIQNWKWVKEKPFLFLNFTFRNIIDFI